MLSDLVNLKSIDHVKTNVNSSVSISIPIRILNGNTAYNSAPITEENRPDKFELSSWYPDNFCKSLSKTILALLDSWAVLVNSSLILKITISMMVTKKI